MQIDAEIREIKSYRILGPVCCRDMLCYLERPDTFNNKYGFIKVGAKSVTGLVYWTINYCPFCGEKITHSETR